MATPRPREAIGRRGALSQIRAPCTAHDKMLHRSRVHFWAQSQHNFTPISMAWCSWAPSTVYAGALMHPLLISGNA